MALKRWIMHVLNNGTLDEAVIIRQIVVAIGISQSLLPQNKNTKGNGSINWYSDLLSTVPNAKYVRQKLPMQ